MLKHREFVSIGMALEDGKLTHVNHEGCPAGTDTKRRLYVRREGKLIKAHCHNCGNSGVYDIRPGKGGLPMPRRLTPAPATRSKKDLRIEKRGPLIDPDLIAWLKQYPLPDAMLHVCEQAYVNHKLRLGVPVPTGLSARSGGMQWRSLTDKPKWLNDFTDEQPRGVFFPTYTPGNPVVIVEDPISAYVLAYQLYDVVCLYSTRMTDPLLRFVCSLDPSSIAIWLDDDAAGHAGAAKLKRTLELFADVVVIRHPEPKLVPSGHGTIIRDALNGLA